MIQRMIKNKKLIQKFYEFKFNKLFQDNEKLFLAFLLNESGHDLCCVRYEPEYRYVIKDKKNFLLQKMSYGLFQIMGANLITLRFPLKELEDFLQDINLQFRYCRMLFRKCPSTNVYENLMWWNTGTTKETKKGLIYINRIKKLVKKF